MPARLLTLLLALFFLPVQAEHGTPSGVLAVDQLRFVTANAEFTLMHEMGHLLIHELHLPVLGREEDAADQLGFYGLLLMQREQLDKNFYGRLLDVADYWRLQWQHSQANGGASVVWDSHALDQQRFYNLSCLIYGSDPDHLEWVLEVTGLPIERALYCDQEYAQVEQAVQWLLTRIQRERPEHQGQAIRVIYEEPLDSIEHGPELLSRVRASKVLENVAQRASSLFYLPRALQIRVQNCGAADAWYDRNTGELSLCWELIDHYARLMPALQQLREQQRLAVKRD